MFQIALFQANPQMKQLVKMAVEKSIEELLVPVVEGTIKVSLTTCEQIIKKVGTIKVQLTTCEQIVKKVILYPHL